MSKAVKSETSSLRAARLMREVSESKQSQYPKGDVKTILNSIVSAGDGDFLSESGCRGPVSMDVIQRGDVFIAAAIGGKVRPWIVLSVDGDAVSAVSLSSGDSAPNMTKSRCRLWPSSWIGSTISQFSLDHAKSEVSRPYTNLSHLSQVQADLIERMKSDVSLAPVTCMSQILNRMRGAEA